MKEKLGFLLFAVVVMLAVGSFVAADAYAADVNPVKCDVYINEGSDNKDYRAMVVKDLTKMAKTPRDLKVISELQDDDFNNLGYNMYCEPIKMNIFEFLRPL
ncbi:MAG: hypothetical protein [Caudoviricetes sp.]|nr:MAG: hypothetical protein [Caudoviricetes sp.]